MMAQTALVFGNGPSAALAARELSTAGLEVQTAAPEGLSIGGAPAEWEGSAIQAVPRSCRRDETGYRIGLEGPEGTREVRADHLVVAVESLRTPNFGRYGLEPSARAVSLSQAAAGEPDLPAPASGGVPTVLFLLGLARESHPVLTEEALRCALAFRERTGARCVVVTGNLKVAASGLEALYRDCRSRGIGFVKRTTPPASIRQDESGGVRITYRDEVTREDCTLRADLTVVDEEAAPAKALAGMAQVLELETDAAGFLQADNVHRLPVSTNRKNVWVIGPSRTVAGADAVRADVDCLVEAALRGGVLDLPPPEDRARIDTGLCVRCLTCHRLCPYRAVTIGSRMAVDPERCERCGICAAECPAVAIRIPGLEPGSVPERLEGRPEEGGDGPSPEMLAFCCSRSAVPAREMAAAMGRALPAGLRILEVPCAGSVSVRHLLSALQAGADGVLLLHCHPDNCHSGTGNRLAARRLAHVREMASAIGLDPERIQSLGLASNMGAVLADRLNAFEASLRDRSGIP